MSDFHTDGSRGLRAFLDRNRIKQAAAARAIGVHPPTMFDWLDGNKRPRPVHRRKISVWTGGEVPESAWELPIEAAEVNGVAPYRPATDDAA